jgi:hypothetical protein
MAAGPEKTTTTIEQSRRIRVRRARHWLIGIAVTLLVAWFLFAQSPLTPRLVLPPLARLLGVGVSADGVSIGVNGVVAFDRLRFTVTSDGSTGPASVLAEAKRATGRLKLSSLVRGRIRLSELVLIEPTVRVSQSTQTGKLNLSAIDTSTSGGAAGTPSSGPPEIGEVPTILVSGGAVLLGEHDDNSFTLLRRMDVDGKIEPASAPARGFDFHFHEVKAHDAAPDLPALDLRGTFTSDGLALDLTGFSLESWPSKVLPGPLRTQVSALELAGRISRATLRYDFRGIPSARLDLEDVAVTLPVSADAAAGTLPGESPQSRLRMTKTSGSIELSDQGLKAKISGKIEDLPYTADLTTSSADPDGPFTLVLSSSGYELGKNPPFRRFLNDTVKERLQDFGNPTGTTTTIATITRGPKINGAPGEITTKGQLRIENGVAAFHKFPYEFRSITAVLNFTENAIEIASLRGTAASGATIFAQGTISPLTDGAEVALDIITKGVPVDEVLEAAMKPGEREAVQRMFSRPDMARLKSQGLVSAKLGDGLPAFPFRGVCDITIRLTRDLGDEGEWHQDIRVNIPRAGLIAAPFPIPAVGNNLQLLIGDDAATVVCEDLRPLSGGTASLHASVDLAELRRGGDVTPHVTIQARDVPMDALARQAILMAATRQNEAGRARLQTILDQCHLNGVVNADVEVSADTTAGAEPGDISVQVRADGFTASPSIDENPGPARLNLEDGWALLTASDREVDLAIGGQLRSSQSVASPNAKFRLVIPQRVVDDTPPRSRIDVHADSLALDSSIDRLVEVVSAEAAAAIADQARQRGPVGSANVAATIEIDHLGSDLQSVHDVTVVIDHFAELSILEMGQRIWLTPQSGALRIEQRFDTPGTRIKIQNLEGRARFSSDSPASSPLHLNADLLISRDTQGKQVPTQGTLSLQASDLAFESPSIRAIASSHAPALSGIIKNFEPAGTFDLDLLADFSRSLQDHRSVTGSIFPHSIAFDSPLFVGKRVALSQGGGRFDFDTRTGWFRSLSAAGSSWSGTVDGSVVFEHAPGVPRFEIQLAGTGTGTETGAIPDDLQALLPQAIREIVSDLSISLEPKGQFVLDKSTLNYTAGETPEARALSTSGTLRFSGGQADVGVWLKGATGSLAFAVERPRFDQPATWSVDADIAQTTAAKVALSDLRFRASNGSTDGDVLIPQITALCHGGRLAGAVSIVATPSLTAGQPAIDRLFDVSLRAAGVHFAPVLADLKVDSAAGTDEPLANTPPANGNVEGQNLAQVKDNDTTRGILDGDATIRGIIGQPLSRTGRGSATVGGGRILPSSGLMQLIRISNLQFPSDEPLDLARASWFLSGPVVNFEELSVASRSVSIVGYGTMTVPEMAIDLRFDSRSARRIPIISKVVELIRDQLITTRVRGTADNPKFEVVPIPVAGRALDTVAGRKNEQILERLRQEADARRNRDSD